MDKQKIIVSFFEKYKLKVNSINYGRGYILNHIMSIRLEEFPNNCGMKILTGLGPTADKERMQWQYALLEYVKYEQGKHKDKPGLLLYTINASQKDLEPVLEEAGFGLMWEGFNPHHGSKHVIKAYAYDLYEYKKEEKDALPSLR